MRRILIASLFVGVLVALGLGSYLRHWWHAPLALPDAGVTLTIERGDSLGGISARLAEDGALRHPRLVNLIARWSGADQRIGEGEYLLLPGNSPASMLALLQSDDTVRYLVTLPEGLRLAEAIEILAASDGIDPVLQGPDDPQLKQLVSPALSAEGYFLPETYQYQRGDTDLAILSEAHRLMRETLQTLWTARQPHLPLDSPYDALILASIIEKETGTASERAEIGGVFVRRLQKGMRLQTDPTVIYGLGDQFDGNLRREHLRDESNPYNSYRHHGLPPGPIALPGRDALMAAMQPAEGDSLYFVARGDGSHQFSATLEEHEAAVARYQLQRREGYRSSPEARP